MSNFEVKPATRQTVKPLIGLYGRSGSGKSMSALLLARGIVGPKGRIVAVDSENGRISLFADVIPGGFSVIDLDAPFTPERYQEAITTAEANADCVVVDSLSHEHNGEGGVLDMQEAELDRMAGENWQKREACKMASWIKPKLAHKQFIGRLLRLKVALICCLRGEEKTHMVKGGDNKNKVVTDDFSSPLFDSRFIFELLLNFETISRDGQGGYVIPRKITHPAIASLLPKENEQIGIKHGEALAAWCSASAGGTHVPLSNAAAPAGPTVFKPTVVQPSQSAAHFTADTPEARKELKAQLWKLLLPVRGADKKWDTAEKWLRENKIMGVKEYLGDATVEQLGWMISEAIAKLDQGVVP